MTDATTEISFEVTDKEAEVLDGYCSAKGIKRTKVMRELLREWTAAKHHEATVIIRVAGVKPDATGVNRNE
jgi:oligoribonuclease (3'-5' exoribonuclease)